jgi:hypothetical protein
MSSRLERGSWEDYHCILHNEDPSDWGWELAMESAMGSDWDLALESEQELALALESELALALEAELVLALEAELVLESELVLAVRTVYNNQFHHTPSPGRRMWLCRTGVCARSFSYCKPLHIGLLLEHMSSRLERGIWEDYHCSLHRQKYRFDVMRQQHDLVVPLHVRHNHICPLTGAPAFLL